MVSSLRLTGWAPPVSCCRRLGRRARSAGVGVLAPESLVRCVDVLGPRHVAPCLRSACAEVRLEDAACWPLRGGKERGVVGVALGHDLHLRWGDVYYGDGGSHEAQGVHLACRMSVNVRLQRAEQEDVEPLRVHS